MDPALWEIGPTISGKNYSSGMPLHPAPLPEGWVIELPQPSADVGHVGYVTMRYGSLSGKKRITMRYRLEVSDGAKVVPRTNPELPSILTLYFQRANDNWSGEGQFEAYRWWATPKSHLWLKDGTYEMSVGLDEKWTAVSTSSSLSNPTGFAAAIQGADRVGFTLGGGEGYGKGVFATGPARLIVTGFQVE